MSCFRKRGPVGDDAVARLEAAQDPHPTIGLRTDLDADGAEFVSDDDDDAGIFPDSFRTARAGMTSTCLPFASASAIFANISGLSLPSGVRNEAAQLHRAAQGIDDVAKRATVPGNTSSAIRRHAHVDRRTGA